MTILKPKYIILHHSLTKDTETVSWGAIRKYHMVNGFNDIGYHAGIENLRGNFEVLLGRSMDTVGAHCADGGKNYDSLGVCMVGNFDYSAPPVRQWDKAIESVAWMCRQFVIPYYNIMGHREFNKHKTCPGRMFDVCAFQDEVKDRNTRWFT
jgi:N-acetylmuramoyl-L-alanine amidase